MVSMMPKDTVFVTIVREPSSQFKSLFSYTNYEVSCMPTISRSLNFWVAHRKKAKQHIFHVFEYYCSSSLFSYDREPENIDQMYCNS